MLELPPSLYYCQWNSTRNCTRIRSCFYRRISRFHINWIAFNFVQSFLSSHSYSPTQLYLNQIYFSYVMFVSIIYTLINMSDVIDNIRVRDYQIELSMLLSFVTIYLISHFIDCVMVRIRIRLDLLDPPLIMFAICWLMCIFLFWVV